MGWQIINQILGEASIDPEFCQELLAHPILAEMPLGVVVTDSRLGRSLQEISVS